MKILLIFLTLPLFLFSTQQETNEIEHMLKDMPLMDYFEVNLIYKEKFEVYAKGHVWIPCLFYHSDNCPCHSQN